MPLTLYIPETEEDPKQEDKRVQRPQNVECKTCGKNIVGNNYHLGRHAIKHNSNYSFRQEGKHIFCPICGLKLRGWRFHVVRHINQKHIIEENIE